METRKYLFETAWKQYIAEAAASEAIGDEMMGALERATTEEQEARAYYMLFKDMTQQQIESAIADYEARPPRWWVRYKNWLRRRDRKQKLQRKVAVGATAIAADIILLMSKLPEKFLTKIRPK